MTILIIINDPPYGTERAYNALRLANSLEKLENVEENVVFPMADAVQVAKAGQKTPEGYFNLERMTKRFIASGGRVLLCGSCMDAQGLRDSDLVEGAARSNMDVLAAETIKANKVLVF